MARDSRPPGFDMTYKPEGATSFGPPLKERLPAILYFAFAILLSAFVVYGENAPSSSRAFQYVVEGDRHRMIPSSVCAIVMFGSALAAVLRARMRGVVVHPDGIELRELLTLGWPRVRRFHWSQIDRLFVPSAKDVEASEKRVEGATGKRTIHVDLWDGSRALLPEVDNVIGLAVMLEKIALARAIPIVGATGLLDDDGTPLEAA
jgi:hypothetical protein